MHSSDHAVITILVNESDLSENKNYSDDVLTTMYNNLFKTTTT